MSAPDTQPALPEATPPQFYPVQFHPEFGYLAPTLRFRRKVSLVGKGAVFGAIVGVITVTALWPDRDARLRSVFNMQTQAGEELASAPVRFIAPTLAMRTSAARATPSEAAPAPTAADPASVVAVAPAAAPPPGNTNPARAEHKAAPKPKKKVARQPRREHNVRPVELDPRNAHAGPYRQPAEPQRDWNDRRAFGFGW